MLCPQCQTPAYFYEQHAFWQCPSSTCNHSWKDSEIVPAETISAAEIDAKAKARRQRIRIQAALADAAGIVTEAIPGEDGKGIRLMIEGAACLVAKVL